MPARKRLTAAVLAAVSVLAIGVGMAPAGTGATVTPKILLGAYTPTRQGETMIQAVQRTEALVGRPLAAVRVYLNWDSAFGSKYHLWLRDTGHAVFLSVKAKRSNGTFVLYSDIANAQPGSALYAEIVGWAKAMKAFTDHVYFTFNHEPEARVAKPSGDSAGFVKAWRKIVSVFRAQGVTNVSYVWTMTDYAFTAKDERAAAYWYPGDYYVNDIGADVYNWYTCRPTNQSSWKSLGEKLEPIRQFGLLHPAEGLVLEEFGSVEDPAVSTKKGSWFTDAETLLQQPGYEQVRALLYFSSQDQNYPDCKWYVDTSQSSLSGFKTLGADPFFKKFE
jgi:hypothetical protein